MTQPDPLVEALERIKRELTIPAAEYVPAIPDVWAIIDEALSIHRAASTVTPQGAGAERLELTPPFPIHEP